MDKKDSRIAIHKMLESMDKTLDKVIKDMFNGISNDCPYRDVYEYSPGKSAYCCTHKDLEDKHFGWGCKREHCPLIDQ